MLRLILFFILIQSFSYSPVSGQSPSRSSKHEIRGVWIATVNHIDWPSRGNNIPADQRQELIDILDSHQKTGINAIYLQVRPSADAFYGRGRELWSQFLTGKQGVLPAPYWDPLDFAIAEAHKRGMELHAWLNPYRASNDLEDSNIHQDHILNQKPDWFFKYGKKNYFNPGLPEVREYITQVILDVARNYDVDGIHFDDYFYPYPERNSIPDSAQFKEFGQGFNSIHDWRRNNVNIFIRDLSDSIHRVRKHLKFGVSPYGIWRNKADVAHGSETSGNITLYHSLYADARKWAQEGWIDYVVPQIYFPFYYKVAPFEKMTDWWAGNGFGKHVYIGEAPFLANRESEGWREKDQLPRQIRYQRQNSNVKGSIHFSSKSLTDNLGGFRDSLRNDLYRYPALIPPMPWLDNVAPQAPTELRVMYANQKCILNWKAPDPAPDGDQAFGYVIYRFEKNGKMDLRDPGNILEITFNRGLSYTDLSAERGKSYVYIVTAIDRLKNESKGSETVSIRIPND